MRSPKSKSLQRPVVYLVSIVGLGLMFISSLSLNPVSAAKPAAARLVGSAVSQSGIARSMRPRVSVSENGRHWTNLLDGFELPTTYVGATSLEKLLRQNLAKPLSLASADFDEDGVPDLVCGYAATGGGIITMHRGNLYSIFPNTAQQQVTGSTDSLTDFPDASVPFYPEARVFDVPESPEFLGAGDFNNDGHWDVIAAARGSHVLYLLPGDGKGGFGKAKEIELPGSVTALVTGEINRADGLTDVVVGISGPDGPQALVFEGPDGALRATPEAIALPAEASAMALGQLDDSFEMDLAIAAGKDLIIVHGRDRQFSTDNAKRQSTMGNSRSDRRSFPFEIKSLALGDFIWDEQHQTDIALLSDDGDVHLLTNPTRLAATSEGSAQSQTVTKRISEWPMETLWTSTQRPVPSAQLVRAKVSSLPTDDLVVVDGAHNQVHIIMTYRLPGTEGADTSVPVVSLPPSVDLEADSAPVAVLPMRLNGDALSDVVILTEGLSVPVAVMTAPDATITVTTTADDITPNDGSVSLREAITAIDLGNDLGDSDITAQNPGTFGVNDTIKFNIAGGGVKTINVGTSASALNMSLPVITKPVTIDGYTQPGSSPNTLSTGDNAVLLIELNGTSVGAFPQGLRITAGSSTVKGLVINRFNSVGMLLQTNGGDVIAGNFIGTNVSGSAPLGNTSGVFLDSGVNNSTIGGTTAAARNLISGTSGDGVDVVNGVTGNLIQGNYIGTDKNGVAALGNTGVGVAIANIGTHNNTLGGTTSAARNVISGNTGGGVGMGSSNTNIVQGNFIGVQADGINPLGNAGDGVSLSSGSTQNNTIGGTAAGAGNTIAFNGGAGVSVDGGASSTGNAIRHNSIFSNTKLGIDLVGGTENGFGVTANDPCDPDTGPNNLQNWPVLASASSSGGTTTIMGTLNSTPNRVFVLDFFANGTCDPSGNGQGQTFLGSQAVGPTDGTCNVVFTVTLPVTVSPGQNITATATDSVTNDTSEFSNCVGVSGPTCSLTCPTNINKSTDPGQCAAVVTFAPTVIGSACGAVSCTPPSGSTFPKGSTTVTCSAAGGPSCMFTVTVNDNQPPTITCPANITSNASAASCPIATPGVVTFPSPTASDNCGIKSVVCNPPSGSTFPMGTTTVTCTATDTSNLTSMCSFTVTVVGLFSFCLQDETTTGNFVLINAMTGDYIFFCNGVQIASGTGKLTAKGCQGSIEHIKGDRRVFMQWDTTAQGGQGAGTATLELPVNNIKCQIIDKNMSNNTCSP